MNPEVAPSSEAMLVELGNVLPCLIYMVATATNEAKEGPLLASKLDISYGYWCTVVPPEDEWKFADVLPKASPDGQTSKTGHPLLPPNGLV